MRTFHVKLRQITGRIQLHNAFCADSKIIKAYSTEDAVKKVLPLYDRLHFDAHIYTDWGEMVAWIHGDHAEMYKAYEIIDINGTYTFKPEN